MASLDLVARFIGAARCKDTTGSGLSFPNPAVDLRVR